MRVFPLSNWTERDIWTYIAARQLPVAPLYFAAERLVADHAGAMIVVNDARYPWPPGQTAVMRRVRFRTVGCWPVTGAILSDADTLEKILAETEAAAFSERQGRLIDGDDGGSLEKKKREGYF